METVEGRNKLVTKYNLTGECEINVKLVAKKWNDRFWISQWHEEYTLCRHAKNASNFSKTNLKVRIPKQQAHELIGSLNLIDDKSTVFRNARTWMKDYNSQTPNNE